MPGPSPTPSQWRTLLHTADRVRRLQPWRWVGELDLFGVRVSGVDEPVFVSVLGNAEEHFAVVAYLGCTALGHLLRIHDPTCMTDPRRELTEAHWVSVSFEERGRQDEQDRQLLGELGMRFSGPHAWPSCRAQEPAFLQRLPDHQEAAVLQTVLEQLLQVAPRFRNNDDLLHPEDLTSYLLRVREDGTWTDVYEQIPLMPMPWEQNRADVFTTQLFRQLPRRQGTVDVAFDCSWSVLDDGEHPPCYIYVLLLMDPSSGLLLGMESVGPGEPFAEVWSRLPASLANQLRRSGGLPAEIRVAEPRVAQALDPVLMEAAGLQVTLVDELPALEDALESMQSFLSAGGGASVPGEPGAELGDEYLQAAHPDPFPAVLPTAVPAWVDVTDPLDTYSLVASAEREGGDSGIFTPRSSRDEYEGIIRATAITQDAPGTILRDAQTFLDLAFANGIKLTPSLRLPQLRFIRTVNERLCRPLEIGLRRPRQQSFPNVLGLYSLLTQAGLICQSRPDVATIDPTALLEWRELSPTDAYFSLLEAWLCGPSGLPGDESPAATIWPLLGYANAQQHTQRHVDMTWRLGQGDQEALAVDPGLMHLAVMGMFGLLEIHSLSAVGDRGWIIHSLSAEPWGNALLDRFLEYAGSEHADKRQRELREKGGPEPEQARRQSLLMAAYQPCVPDWQRLLSSLLPSPRITPAAMAWADELLGEDEDEFFDEADLEPTSQLELDSGAWQVHKAPEHKAEIEHKSEPMYVFKVALRKSWRRLGLAASCTAHELAATIVAAFEFDFDHLYSLLPGDGKPGHEDALCHHPAAHEGPYATDLTLDDLPVGPGARMTLLYDYGDEWHFRVELEDVTTVQHLPGRIVELDSRGRPPRQYGGS
jgi:uncharacterized protein DUF6930/pRiA4b ORF-3-like protein